MNAGELLLVAEMKISDARAEINRMDAATAMNLITTIEAQYDHYDMAPRVLELLTARYNGLAGTDRADDITDAEFDIYRALRR